MKIHAYDTNTTYTITLRSWDGAQWSPDCFDDLEQSFPKDHPDRIPGDFIIVSTSDEVKNLIGWWRSEVKNANENPEYCGDGLCADGREWLFDVDQAEEHFYFITDREAGNVIDVFESIEDARAAIEEYYRTDKENGDYTPGFYTITNAARMTIE